MCNDEMIFCDTIGKFQLLAKLLDFGVAMNQFHSFGQNVGASHLMQISVSTV